MRDNRYICDMMKNKKRMNGNNASLLVCYPQGHHKDVYIHNIKIFHDEKADYFPDFTACSHGVSQRHELQPSASAGPVPDGQDGLRAEPHR